MNILSHLLKVILSLITTLILIRNEKIYQAHKHTHPPNKQNKIYPITKPNPNNIHYPNDPNTKVHIIILKITNPTHSNDLAPK